MTPSDATERVAGIAFYGGAFDIRDADRKGTVVEVTFLQSSRASDGRQGERL